MIEQAYPYVRDVETLLDEIPDAYEQAQRGLWQAKEGGTISLDEL
jgi:hypothetical protein